MSAIELVQITVSTKISGSEMSASSQGTPKNACVIHAPATPSSGTPTPDIHSGSSMCASTSVPGCFLPRSVRHALVIASAHPHSGALQYLRPYLSAILVGSTLFSLETPAVRLLCGRVLGYLAPGGK